MPLWTLSIPPELSGNRLDIVVSRFSPLSRNAAQNLIVADRVTRNAVIARKNDRVNAGDFITADIPDASPCEDMPEDIALDIVYEDDDLIVINKPQGLVVHPSHGHDGGTLVNALLHHCAESLSGIGGVRRPGIVHRIDKDTSGLLVVAKTDFTHVALSAALKSHSVTRVYECIVIGTPKEDSFTISAPLARHPVDRKRQAVCENGRDAVTHVEVLARYNGHSHLRCRLETGRTHQIRVHLSYKGYPILGDPLYNNKSSRLPGQILCAKELTFIHPRSGEEMHFTVALPDIFIKTIYTIGGKNAAKNES